MCWPLHAHAGRLIVHVGSVAAVETDGFAVHTDGERRTQHRDHVADVGRGDDVLEHRAGVSSLVNLRDSRAVTLRLLGVAFERGLRDRLPGVDGVDVDAVRAERVGHRFGQVDGANVADAPTHSGAGGAAGAAADVDDAPPAGLLQIWSGCLDRAQVAHHLLFEVAQDVHVAYGLNGARRA